MKLTRFDPRDSEAMAALLDLYFSWGHPESCPTPEELPSTGYIVPGKAAVFLYSTDSSLATLEHAITMRDAEGHTEAIHAICDALIADAKAAGFTKLYVYCGNQHAVRRALAVGFGLSLNAERWQLEMRL
jgi:hypothetical protein